MPLVDAINITPFIYTKLLLHIRKSILLKTCKNKIFFFNLLLFFFFEKDVKQDQCKETINRDI